MQTAPAEGADRAAATTFGDVAGSLRDAAVRRDAPVPAIPAPDRAAVAAQQAARSGPPPASLTVSTALAAYAAAVATAPRSVVVAAPPPPEELPAREEPEADEAQAAGEPASPAAPAYRGRGNLLDSLLGR